MISVNLRDASTHTRTHGQELARVLENDVSSREIEKPLFEKVFLRICSLLSSIDSFAFLSRRRERKEKERWMRIYFWKFVYYENFFDVELFNCFEEKRFFTNLCCEIFWDFFLSFWILRSTLKSNCRVSMRFWDYFWIHKEQ